MDQLVFTVGVPATSALVATVYTTGGRNALDRRAIQQDLEIADRLPAGHAREVLRRMAADKALGYSSRWLGPRHLTMRGHIVHAVVAAGGAGLTLLGNELLKHPAAGVAQSSAALLITVLGLGALASSLASWVIQLWAAEAAKTRPESVEEGRSRASRYLGGRGDETKESEAVDDCLDSSWPDLNRRDDPRAM